MDRFQDMQTFVKVVEAGSISRAAERMDIAKSAASRRIAELEERLGVQLIRRTTRQLNLTDVGRSFYERCVRILADVDEAELAVTQEHATLRGRLRVAVPMSFGLMHLGPAITEFMCAHPQLTVELDLNDRRVDLLEEGFDVAIRIGELPDSSFIARRLATIQQLVCASPAYLARNGTPKSAAELADHTSLVYGNVPDPGTWWYTAPDGKQGSVRVPIRLQTNNGEFLRQAAIAGLGVVLEPTFITFREIQSGQLVPILIDHQWRTANAYAVYPHTRHLSQRVRAFVDFLAERFSGVPYWDRFTER